MVKVINAKRDLIPTELAITALRDSGYKNTAYAVAELLDNAIQAGASKVDLICVEALNRNLERARMQIFQIAVLDNGTGMNADQLEVALQFGNGDHLNDTTGMGKFGMGLPNSSISQAKKVEVWSWQDGQDPVYSLIDIDNLGDGTVPVPVRKEIPEVFKQASENFAESGTLVVWSNLDRCLWKTAAAIMDNSESLIGRMYRKFIASQKVVINLSAIDKANPQVRTMSREAKANDPMYLIVPSNTPSPYDTKAMFNKFGERDSEFKIAFGGQEHTVRIRYSIVSDEIRNNVAQAGSKDYGQHAAKNVGVSILREGRELTLDQNLVISHDTRERWWGVEVEFPASLDKVFGVTNNKQEARNFDAVAKVFSNMGTAEQNSFVRDQAQRNEDLEPSGPLFAVVQHVNSQIETMRTQIKVKKVSRAGPGRHGGGTPEDIGTGVIIKRSGGGHRGKSDDDFDNFDDKDRKKILKKELVKDGVSPNDADEIAKDIIASGRRIIFHEKDLEGNAFFTVRSVAGEIYITINSEHNAFKNLLGVLDGSQPEDTSIEGLKERLNLASDGLRLLLIAWARYEDEQPSDELRRQVADIRSDWGRVAADFLRSR